MNFTAAGRQSGFGEEYSSGGGNPPPPPSAAEMGMIDREHMFDKVVTPSDVGKLNRLVIPKQHAERFFPLDSGSNEKGLLLNFEDRNGKPWRFRYSYWNSSQSYVMTKGWSRFVKEKKLDAGDVVSFHRGLLKDRLFIDWRRRPCPPPPALPTANPWGTFLMQNPHHYQYQYHHPYPAARGGGGSIMYLRGAPQFPVHNNNNNNNNQLAVFESVPVVQGKAAAKRLRLFGVNMDCPISAEDEEEEDDVLVMSSSSPSAASTTMFPSSHHHQYQYHRLPSAFDSSSSSSSSSLARLRHNDGSDDKGKGSMSLDLDI